ncbi:hypothetical protein HIM_07006 [Hirsutella minnesotensis 3608]|uniref:Protein RCR2 n=1 Tax=Hirsutella minnesotensis 3608 TaxID=1043627 RepID=A0A0F7ZTT5_9HYPO|nr:hypothetical protein HIM_07006 [Hirsutella minnesotensis 3608]
MAPTETSGLLQPRYYECFGDTCVWRHNRWYDWGRWVFLAGFLIIVLLVLFSCSCVARRRRRHGAQPMYGTGWMALGAGKHDGQNHYQAGYGPQAYGQQQGYPAPPPAYGQPQQPQYTGTTFNQHDGYYGNANAPPQQYGVQQPPNAYHPDGNYAAPTSPPPAK